MHSCPHVDPAEAKAQFKAAELEFHQQQLQHVSEEQRQAEELIQISLDQNGGG